MSFPTLPRPTRSADAFARSEAHTTQFDLRNPSTLPPDAPTDDPLLDADEIGKRGTTTKRNAVNIDGYESDSSNEGFDGRVAAKKKRKMDDEGDGDGDMFADDVNEDGGEARKGEDVGKEKKKGVTFMEADETVQGEVLGSKSGGHVSADFSVPGDHHNGISTSTTHSAKNQIKESQRRHPQSSPQNDNNDDSASSSSESEVDDETRADIGSALDTELGAGSKKHHAPKLDAFNMRAETEEGRFDSSGNYVRKAADPDARHDIWLEGVSKRDMRRAREAMEAREAEMARRRVEDDKVLTKDLLAGLIKSLEVGETVIEALGRLGTGKKKKGKGKRGGMDVDAGEEEAREVGRREAVEAITGAADMLLSRGQEEIYDTERELLARQYQRETGEAWVDSPKAEVEEGGGEGGQGAGGVGGMWQYRWMDGRDGGKVYGGYDAPLMKAWVEAGFFDGDVEFCKVGEQEWLSSVRFV